MLLISVAIGCNEEENHTNSFAEDVKIIKEGAKINADLIKQSILAYVNSKTPSSRQNLLTAVAGKTNMALPVLIQHCSKKSLFSPF